MNNNKNIIFNHTLEQYNKKYKNRTYKLIKYTKKQVEDFDKQYGHYTYNGKTHSLEFNNYLLKDRKWWFTKEDECYHEIPRPIRFVWFRNLNTGVQIATCALLAGGVIAGSTVGIIEYKKYDASLTIMGACEMPLPGASCKIGSTKTDKNGNKVIKVLIEYTDEFNPPIEGEKLEIADVSVTRANIKLEKFVDYTFNSATGEVVINKEAEEKYYGRSVITPVVKIIKKGCTQGDWMEKYKEFDDIFQNQSATAKRYEIKDIKVLGMFSDAKGKLHKEGLAEYPLDFFVNTNGERAANLIFDNTDNPSKPYFQCIGGGEFSHKYIKNNVFNKYPEDEGYKIDYIIAKDYVKYDIYNQNGLYRSCTFNNLGYITNTYAIGASKGQFIIEYNGAPSIDDYYNITSHQTMESGSLVGYSISTGNSLQFKLQPGKTHVLKFKTKTSGKKIYGLSYFQSAVNLNNLNNLEIWKNNTTKLTPDEYSITSEPVQGGTIYKLNLIPAIKVSGVEIDLKFTVTNSTPFSITGVGDII